MSDTNDESDVRETARDVRAVATNEIWTPAQGLLRGVCWGLLWAVGLAGLLFPVAWYVPPVVLNIWLRASLGFLVAWILIGVIQDKSETIGTSVSAAGVVLALLVMLSNHFAFAMGGVWTRQGMLKGSEWFSPFVLVWCNYSAVIGIGLATWYRHDGEADFWDLVYILTRRR